MDSRERRQLSRVRLQSKQEWRKRNLEGYSYEQGLYIGMNLFMLFVIWLMVFAMFNLFMFLTVAKYSYAAGLIPKLLGV
jgi:uncharacterized membrane protein